MITDVTDVIDALIVQADQRQDEEKRAAQEAFAKLVESARQRAREILNSADPTLADLLSPYMVQEEARPFNYGYGSGIELEWKFEADALSLCPILLHIALPPQYREGDYVVVFGAKKDINRYPAANVANAIAQARRGYGEYHAWRIEEEKSRILKALKVWDNEDGRKKALAARDELIAKFPDETATWKSAFKELGEAVAQREMNRREDELHTQKQARARDKYRDEYVAFLKEHDRIQNENREKARGVQEAFNQPITLWRLEYGVIAVDEGEKYIDTRETWVGEPDPNEEGWLTAYGQRTRFFYPVSVTKKEIHPVDGVDGFISRHFFAGFSVHVAPGVTREEVERALNEAGVIPLPQRPDAPPELDSYEAENVRDEARHITRLSEYE